MPTPTRLPNGVVNARKSDPLGMYGVLDPTKWCEYFEDFHYYTAADWTITRVGTTPTEALSTTESGGNLLLTMAATDDSSDSLQKVGAFFTLATGKKAIYKARFKVSDATQSDFVLGLQIVDTTPLDVTDGIYFIKDDGDAQLDIVCRKDATTGSTRVNNIATMTTAYTEVAWYFDGVSTLTAFVNGVAVTSLSTTGFLPDAVLVISIHMQNGEAVAKTMTIDYIFAAVER